jgi:tripartite-type tricarboxylate transporter receptor subunit TctC
MINDVPMTLIGKPTLPANNFKELSTWIGCTTKAKSILANAGVGSASHLCGLLYPKRGSSRHDHRALQGHGPGHDRFDRVAKLI